MHLERRSRLHVYYLMNLCNSTHIYYKILSVLKAFNLFLYHLFLTRYADQPTNKNVRFKAQTYTDRGSTINFENEYNDIFIGIKEIIFPKVH